MKKSELKVVSSAKDSYTKTRHNAVRHGILSNVDVLHWEDATELQNLRQGFLDDFKPQGASELYLVEELATIAFRKQRLYKAENALIISHLRTATSSYNLKYTLSEEATLLSGNSDIKADDLSFERILYPDHEKDQENLSYYQKCIETCESIINQDAMSYEEALNTLGTLPEGLLEHWRECLKNPEKWVDSEGNPYTKTIQSLKSRLQEVIDDFSKRKNLIEAKDQIRQQAIGTSYLPDKKMESLQRYETTMDRLFERKLSVLLKLQDIRNSKPLTIQS